MFGYNPLVSRTDLMRGSFKELIYRKYYLELVCLLDFKMFKNEAECHSNNLLLTCSFVSFSYETELLWRSVLCIILKWIRAILHCKCLDRELASRWL